MSLSPHTLVSTDLDGTLLDHFTYSWDAAKPSINALKARGVPIVINTSKTFYEVVELQRQLALDAPFIVENGSAIYFPKVVRFSDEKAAANIEKFDDEFDCVVLGCERNVILNTLEKLKAEHEFVFEGFSDWDTDAVIEHTGLDHASADLALKRQFSEPILWHDSDERFEEFKVLLGALGLRLIKGGRFIHVLGQADKGSALGALAHLLFGEQKTELVCLGDSHNDLDMLNIADYPVFVRSPKHDFPAHHCKHEPYFTEGLGPIGWHEAISNLLSQSISTINPSSGVENG